MAALAGHTLGVLLTVIVACVWVAASQLIEVIFQDLSFDKPYFLTYFNTVGFTFWLLGGLCVPRWRAKLATPPPEPLLEVNAEPSRCGAWTYVFTALSVCPAWMLANYLFNVSLDMTSVASNSVLSSTSNIWTMLFSACFLQERVDPVKVLAVIVAVGGAALVSTSDAGDGHGSKMGDGAWAWAGDALALVSACMYGVYSVMLKRLVPEGDNALSMPLVFGFIGAAVLLGGWPVFVVLDSTGLEPFELPRPRVLAFLALNAAVGTNLSDVLWARALQLTSPLVATLGLSLTIPIGMLSDVALRGKAFSALYVFGALLILVGFVLGTTAEWMWRRLGRLSHRLAGGRGSLSSARSCRGLETAQGA